MAKIHTVDWTRAILTHPALQVVHPAQLAHPGLEDLHEVDWPESTLAMQRNWIGRSEGADVLFKSATPVAGREIRVFTTRPDTLYGATYMVLSPEHPLVEELTTPAQRAAVAAYQQQARHKSDLERTDLSKDKTGVFTGATAVNPVNGAPIPIWIADYVLVWHRRHHGRSRARRA